ncbi:MAG TPA: hypothetical protein PKZ84_09195 [Anaerolineae bacterium]|nr:hypothetical protein [Anaerolineae bacterium]HQI84732.1 hypothetical protein [Anaerolineae bacterium]
MKNLRALICFGVVFVLLASAIPVLADAIPPVDATDVQLVGQFGGASYAVAVQGDYAYVGVGPRLAVLDVSDPLLISLAGQTDVLPTIVGDVAVAGNYAYVAAGTGGMFVVDVTDPVQPTIVGYYAAPVSANGVAVAGDYAYVAAGDNTLRVVSVAMPATPSAVGSVPVTAAQRVAVAGSYAYVVGGTTLTAVNVTNPSSPAVAGTLVVPQSALQDIEAVGDRAYLAAGGAGLYVANIANPVPVFAGSYDTPGVASGVAVAGDYAYVADGYYGLRIINLVNPAISPSVFDTADLASAVVLIHDTAFVADRYRGLRAINVLYPETPVEVGYYDIVGNARSLLLAGRLLYVADDDGGLRILDVADPSQPREVGHYDTPGNAASVAVAGQYAYVADGLDVRIIDISTLTAPTLKGVFPTYNGWAYALAVRQGYLYIAEGGGARGLHVADLVNPLKPVTRAFEDSAGNALDLALAGNRVYLAAESGGLRVIDITNPVSPTTLFTGTKGVNVSDVAVEGTMAYLVDGSRLYGVNVASAPASTVMTWTTPGSAEGVAVVNGIAYVATGYSGLRLVSVANPASPTEIGHYDTPGEALYTAVGQYIYVADGHGGVVILWYGPLASGTVSTSGGALVSEYDGTTYMFPPGAFTDTVVLRHAPVPTAFVPPFDDLSGINHFFNATAVYSSTGKPAQLVPGTVFTISIAYTPAERGVVNEGTLALYYWDNVAWVTSGITRVSTAQTGVLVSRLNHLSLFGVWGEARYVYLPLVMRKF